MGRTLPGAGARRRTVSGPAPGRHPPRLPGISRRRASRGAARPGGPGPLAMEGHRLVPDMVVRDRLTRDTAMSPILMRPHSKTMPPGQFSNVLVLLTPKAPVRNGFIAKRVEVAAQRDGADWRRPGSAHP